MRTRWVAQNVRQTAPGRSAESAMRATGERCIHIRVPGVNHHYVRRNGHALALARQPRDSAEKSAHAKQMQM